MGLFASLSINDIHNSVECSCAVIMLTFAFFIVNLSFIKLRVTFFYCYAECDYTENDYAEHQYAELHYAEHHNAEHHYKKMCSSSVIWCHYICPGVIASLEVFLPILYNFQILVFNLIFQLVSHRY